MPARYWPAGVRLGTRTVNGSFSPVPTGSVTVAGSPVTQQPTPAHRRNDREKALPPLVAVTPVARLTFSFSVAEARLLMSAVAVTEWPAATVIVKYGAE